MTYWKTLLLNLTLALSLTTVATAHAAPAKPAQETVKKTTKKAQSPKNVAQKGASKTASKKVSDKKNSAKKNATDKKEKTKQAKQTKQNKKEIDQKDKTASKKLTAAEKKAQAKKEAELKAKLAKMTPAQRRAAEKKMAAEKALQAKKEALQAKKDKAQKTVIAKKAEVKKTAPTPKPVPTPNIDSVVNKTPTPNTATAYNEDDMEQILRQQQAAETVRHVIEEKKTTTSRPKATAPVASNAGMTRKPAPAKPIGVRREDFPTSAAMSRNDADDLIGSAMGLLGIAYRWGGTSARTGFDCSSFMQHIFRQSLHINLPRTSAEQARAGVPVSRSDLQPGDMVFFNTRGRGVSHVGLYIGNGRFIHAPRTGKSIEITNLNNKFWNSRYVTARRVKH